MSRAVALWSLALLLVFVGCDGDDGDDIQSPEALAGVAARFDLGGLGAGAGFFDFPYPSDLRLSSDGTPNLTGFPNPRDNALVAALVASARQRRHFPLNAVGYFRFDAPPQPRAASDVISASADAPIMLIGVDPKSPAFGALFPVVAQTLSRDAVYVPSNVLAVAARPGVLMRPNAQYAFVVMRSAGAADGSRLGSPLALEQLKAGQVPTAPKFGDAPPSRFAASLSLYQRLWDALDKAGIPRDGVAAATVFSTGDVVAELEQLSDTLRKRNPGLAITDLRLDPDDGDHPRYCELHGKLALPQYQRGQPLFDTEGTFQLGSDGVPIVQRTVAVPVVITIPKKPMPAKGYPLMLYVHGSGGLSTQIVDRGTVTARGRRPIKGEGPAHVIAPHGIAGASMGMPASPERVPGAASYDYLNFKNLAAFRDTFRQGVIDLRHFIDALSRLRIEPSALGACGGATLPTGESAYKLSIERLAAMGQSMGGMYVNMLGAVDKRIGAVVPTGAGGFWSYFLFFSEVFPSQALPAILGVLTDLSFMHPAGVVVQTAWEAADPIIYAQRLSRRPLPGHPARHVYEPVGRGDTYFAPPVFDAMALSYGHQQAGDVVWPEMQRALRLIGRDGIISYPVKDNLKTEQTTAGGTSSTAYTGVVVQYEGDGIYDPHAIAFQLDEVKYQYSCFLARFYASGEGVVLAPRPLGTSCTPGSN